MLKKHYGFGEYYSPRDILKITKKKLKKTKWSALLLPINLVLFVFSLVDTYFMPYGVECDHYSVLGEIVEMEMTTNQITGEKIYILKICSNELTFDVSINIIDIYGEPQIGRRFKGVIWLQGNINFPESFA